MVDIVQQKSSNGFFWQNSLDFNIWHSCLLLIMINANRTILLEITRPNIQWFQDHSRITLALISLHNHNHQQIHVFSPTHEYYSKDWCKKYVYDCCHVYLHVKMIHTAVNVGNQCFCCWWVETRCCINISFGCKCDNKHLNNICHATYCYRIDYNCHNNHTRGSNVFLWFVTGQSSAYFF